MDIIIGAGATGLSYASFVSNDYIVIEADSQIGGYCKTIHQDGFTWDYSGHFFHFQNPQLEEYICEYIHSASLLKCQKHTQINYNGQYIDFPFQKNIHQLNKDEFIDCLYDLFNNKYNSYTNFQEMLYCKFGKSITDKFLIPYNEKLYACSLNKLDTNAMGRFFPFANKEDIIAHFKSARTHSYNDYFTYPQGGAIEYIHSLGHRINPQNISLNEKVVEINLKDKTIKTSKKRTLTYDNLISTLPFPQLLQLTHTSYNPEVYSWNKVLVFNLGFDSKGIDTLNNWVYFPNREIPFYRIGYYDNIFKDTRMSLYVELGYNKETIINIEEAFSQVISGLKKSGIVTCQKLISKHSVIMDPAYVHITEQSIKDVKQHKEELALRHVYSIGRYGSWTYCSIEDGMVEAQQLAQMLTAQ